jgi:hypothetical protein
VDFRHLNLGLPFWRGWDLGVQVIWSERVCPWLKSEEIPIIFHLEGFQEDVDVAPTGHRGLNDEPESQKSETHIDHGHAEKEHESPGANRDDTGLPL